LLIIETVKWRRHKIGNPTWVPFRQKGAKALVTAHGLRRPSLHRQNETRALRFTKAEGLLAVGGDVINGGETHAGAAAALFGGEERLEDAIASLRVHGAAGIGDARGWEWVCSQPSSAQPRTGADDIVEIVSDAAGKLTDALECLRLEQLAFEKADFDNVFGTENAT
jgi:hypothetical protein